MARSEDKSTADNDYPRGGQETEDYRSAAETLLGNLQSLSAFYDGPDEDPRPWWWWIVEVKTPKPGYRIITRWWQGMAIRRVETHEFVLMPLGLNVAVRLAVKLWRWVKWG